jgi:peptidoglycan/xylan/chitin deacetylase (PgdA/CDA1 family)
MLGMLKKIVGARCIFPLYHVVNDFYMPHVDQVFRITSRNEFIKDLDYLLRHFEPVNMHDLLKQPELVYEKKLFHLTFDDGLREMYDVVLPVLLSKGVPATFFINAAFVDNQDLFFRYKQSYLLNEFKNKKITDGAIQQLKNLLGLNRISNSILKHRLLGAKNNNVQLIDDIAATLEVDFQAFLYRRQPYLTSVQIESMINNGFTFGAHSMDHPYYPRLSTEEQITQTEHSVHYVQNSFNLPYRLFAFPFTDHGVGKAFFDYFYGENKRLDFSFGTAGLKDDFYPRNIQRIPVEDSKNAQMALIREHVEYIIKRMLNLHKTKR